MISADTDTGDIGSSHDNIVEPTGRGATGGSAEPPGSITIGGTVITREQAMDALLADALRSKVIPEEHDDLIIGIAEATRRSDQRQARQKGGQATGHKRKYSTLVRRLLVQSIVMEMPEPLRRNPRSEGSIDHVTK